MPLPWQDRDCDKEMSYIRITWDVKPVSCCESIKEWRQSWSHLTEFSTGERWDNNWHLLVTSITDLLHHLVSREHSGREVDDTVTQATVAGNKYRPCTITNRPTLRRGGGGLWVVPRKFDTDTNLLSINKISRLSKRLSKKITSKNWMCFSEKERFGFSRLY